MQNENIITYWEKFEGQYFQLEINGKQVGSNTSKGQAIDKEESTSKIKELLQYAKHNDKIEIRVSHASNMTAASGITVFNTQSGDKENKNNTMQSFGGNESSYQQGFNTGYQFGLNAGKTEAENKHILEKLATIEAGGGAKKGIDAQPILEAMMSSERGIDLVDKITKKLGLQ